MLFRKLKKELHFYRRETEWYFVMQAPAVESIRILHKFSPHSQVPIYTYLHGYRKYGTTIRICSRVLKRLHYTYSLE
jgi:hypothetical protein